MSISENPFSVSAPAVTARTLQDFPFQGKDASGLVLAYIEEIADVYFDTRGKQQVFEIRQTTNEAMHKRDWRRFLLKVIANQVVGPEAPRHTDTMYYVYTKDQHGAPLEPAYVIHPDQAKSLQSGCQLLLDPVEIIAPASSSYAADCLGSSGSIIILTDADAVLIRQLSQQSPPGLLQWNPPLPKMTCSSADLHALIKKLHDDMGSDPADDIMFEALALGNLKQFLFSSESGDYLKMVRLLASLNSGNFLREVIPSRKLRKYSLVLDFSLAAGFSESAKKLGWQQVAGHHELLPNCVLAAADQAVRDIVRAIDSQYDCVVLKASGRHRNLNTITFLMVYYRLLLSKAQSCEVTERVSKYCQFLEKGGILLFKEARWSLEKLVIRYDCSFPVPYSVCDKPEFRRCRTCEDTEIPQFFTMHCRFEFTERRVLPLMRIKKGRPHFEEQSWPAFMEDASMEATPRELSLQIASFAATLSPVSAQWAPSERPLLQLNPLSSVPPQGDLCTLLDQLSKRSWESSDEEKTGFFGILHSGKRFSINSEGGYVDIVRLLANFPSPEHLYRDALEVAPQSNLRKYVLKGNDPGSKQILSLQRRGTAHVLSPNCILEVILQAVRDIILEEVQDDCVVLKACGPCEKIKPTFWLVFYRLLLSAQLSHKLTDSVRWWKQVIEPNSNDQVPVPYTYTNSAESEIRKRGSCNHPDIACPDCEVACPSRRVLPLMRVQNGLVESEAQSWPRFITDDSLFLGRVNANPKFSLKSVEQALRIREAQTRSQRKSPLQSASLIASAQHVVGAPKGKKGATSAAISIETAESTISYQSQHPPRSPPPLSNTAAKIDNSALRLGTKKERKALEAFQGRLRDKGWCLAGIAGSPFQAVAQQLNACAIGGVKHSEKSLRKGCKRRFQELGQEEKQKIVDGKGYTTSEFQDLLGLTLEEYQTRVTQWQEKGNKRVNMPREPVGWRFPRVFAGRWDILYSNLDFWYAPCKRRDQSDVSKCETGWNSDFEDVDHKEMRDLGMFLGEAFCDGIMGCHAYKLSQKQLLMPPQQLNNFLRTERKDFVKRLLGNMTQALEEQGFINERDFKLQAEGRDSFAANSGEKYVMDALTRSGFTDFMRLWVTGFPSNNLEKVVVAANSVKLTLRRYDD
eukprot:g71446.t1